MKARFAVLIVAIACWPYAAMAQQASSQAAPKTKMESFTGETGVVIVKGYESSGYVSTKTAVVNVVSMALRNAQSNEERRGIVVEVREGYPQNVKRSFVDYDEIDGLEAGISYVAKADASITKFKNFEATYSTKGDLKITVFNGDEPKGGIQAAVEVGTYGDATAYLSLPQLTKLRDLIAGAKMTLEKDK